MGMLQAALQDASRAYQRGELEQAERICRRGIESDRGAADLWCLLGIVRRARGALDDAVRCQEEALRLRPDFLEAQNNLGNVLVLQKRYGEAIACYRRVLQLRPDYPEAYNNLGAALRSVDRNDEAMANYRQALRLRPDFPDALSNLADLLQAQGSSAEAISFYQQALRVAPQHAPAHTGLGNALAKEGRLDESVAEHRQALRLRPDFVEAHSNLGKALSTQRKFEEALASYREAIRLRPDFAIAYYNQGVALAELGKLDEALASYEESLRLEPDSTEVLENMGAVLLNQGKHDQALRRFERTPGCVLDSPGAHMGRALIWLMKGDFARGWDEYEWRWKTKELKPPAFTSPPWDGSLLEGRTVLLYAEQGIGDTIQMIRYVPLVKQRGGTVIVACQKPLLALLARCPGIDRLVASDAELPPFDVHAPLLSLPRLFGTTLETIPRQLPYLSPLPALEAHWRRELSPYPGLRIGIVWQGNPQHPADRQRSFPLAALAPLARIEGVHLFSLQKGAGSEQLNGNDDLFPVVDLGRRIDEAAGPFMDTAAILVNLDLVVSSDTSIAHLAGALGVPFWVALAHAADWRWLLDREDSPWYPTARLFRQAEPGDWRGVFARMGDVLRALPKGPHRERPIVVEVGAGELVDKITILEIKEARIGDPAKRTQVRRELDALAAVRTQTLAASAELEGLTAELKLVNEALWEIEDAIRLCERAKDFGERFIALARSVYRQNDRRADLKRRINELTRSGIVEQKQYADYA